MSQSPNRGNIYIAWSDTREGATNSNVYIARSQDGGDTWQTKRVNDDLTTGHNWHPWVCVDQVSGAIYCVFYDRRNYSDDSRTDVYIARSNDGGDSYTNIKINQNQFADANWDYNNIVAHNGIVRPIWARKQSVYTALINDQQLAVGQQESLGTEN